MRLDTLDCAVLIIKTYLIGSKLGGDTAYGFINLVDLNTANSLLCPLDVTANIKILLTQRVYWLRLVTTKVFRTNFAYLIAIKTTVPRFARQLVYSVDEVLLEESKFLGVKAGKILSNFLVPYKRTSNVEQTTQLI